MSDTQPNSPEPPKARTWPRRIGVFIVGFFISLAIGWAIEHVTDREFLEGAEQAQAGWIKSVSETSPIAVAGTFWEELEAAMTGHRGAYSGLDPFDSDMSGGKGIASPVYALVITAARFFAEGGISVLVQLALGALVVALFNLRRTKGEGIFFDNLALNILMGPIAIVACASLIGLVLWGVMLGALYALSWITGLAAAAAGATGVVGFCWYCVTKLGEKSVEHVATPKLH